MPTLVRKLIIYGPFTTAERNALTGLPNYYIIFNSTTAQFEFWTGSAWQVVPSDNPNFQTLTVQGQTTLGGSGSGVTIQADRLVMDSGQSWLVQGSDVASANDLNLGGGNTFEITGTTQINAILVGGSDFGQNGSVITLLFTSTPTVKHNTAGGAGYVSLLLEGGVDFVAEAGDRLNLTLSEIGGTQRWRETGRVRAAARSGTYTPTLTNAANLAASTAYECQWLRVGNIVNVSGKADVDPTLTATATQLGISLPVASNFGAQEDCAGTAFASGIAGQGAAIRADAANDRAEMVWIAGDITNQPHYFHFQYQVI